MIPSIERKDRSHKSTSTRLSLGSKKSSSFGSTYPIQSEISGKRQYLRTWEEPTFESNLYGSSPSALPTLFSPIKCRKRAFPKTNTFTCRPAFTSGTAFRHLFWGAFALSLSILMCAAPFQSRIVFLPTNRLFHQNRFFLSFFLSFSALPFKRCVIQSHACHACHANLSSFHPIPIFPSPTNNRTVLILYNFPSPTNNRTVLILYNNCWARRASW